MCPPDYFTVEYVINPWMDPGTTIDPDKAQATYQAIKSTYESLGVTVTEIEPQPGLPDMTFAANYGTIIGNQFIPANFTYEERQAESVYARKFFKGLGFTITELDPALRFEGQGDLLQAGETYFLGYGPRTDRTAAEALSPILGQEIIPLALVDPLFYHLDTCCAPLGEGAVLIAPRAFTNEGLATIHSHFQTVIEVEGPENATLPCNLVRFDRQVVVSKIHSSHLRQSLEGLGLVVHQVDTNEFQKSGASVKCLTLQLDGQSAELFDTESKEC